MKRLMACHKRDFHGRRINHQTMKNQRDRFSELPEPLIVNVLSLLDMEDAVRTSVLAKSWKTLWTKVDNIVYERFYDKDDVDNMSFSQVLEQREINDARWISFIDHSLMQCSVNRIKSFRLAGFAKFSVLQLEKWISYVLENNVESLKLHVYDDVPDCLFQSSSVTNLELFNVRVNMSAAVNLSSLESLLLERVYMDDAFFNTIMIGCPVLKNLVVRFLSAIRCLILTSVEVLKLWNIGNGGGVLTIRAPNLQELKISGKFPFTKCELVNASSLLKATLTFHTHLHLLNVSTRDLDQLEFNNWVTEYNYYWIPMITYLLESLSYVRELIIGFEPLQVLTLSKLSCTPSPLFLCKRLSIKTYLWKFDIPGIASLLENAPHLETLRLKVVPFPYEPKDAFPFYQTKISFVNGDPHLNMPNGKFLQLKNVKLEYYQKSCHDNIKCKYGGIYDFELVEYILKSSVVLEKLVLCSSRGSCSDITCLVPNCSFQHVSSLCCKLMIAIMSLTGNQAAGWKFNESKNESEFTFSNYASLLSTADSSSSSSM